MNNDEKKRLRKIKREVKRDGNKRVRSQVKRSLSEHGEDADLSDIGYGSKSSEKYNGMDHDVTRRKPETNLYNPIEATIIDTSVTNTKESIMAKKICSLCGVENSPSAKACAHCAYPFDKKQEEKKPEPEKKPEAKPEKKQKPEPEKKPEAKPEKKHRHYSGSALILTPAGSPPCKPSVIEDPSDQDILDWAYAILDKGKEFGTEYAPSALRYFARTFWAGSAHRRVCEVIERVIGA